MTDLLESYLSLGWQLFPCHSIRDRRCTCDKPECSNAGKHPRTQNGVKDASADPDKIAAWQSMWESVGINWAVATGSLSGVFVVDTDPRHGGEWRGDLWGPEPSTLTAITGSNGRHYYFSMPDDGLPLGNRTNVVPGVDVKSDGGYVILPPSAHKSGHVYAWKNEGTEIISARSVLVDSIRRQASTVTPTWDGSDRPERVSEGGRNEYLFRLACASRRRLRDDRLGVEALVRAHNAYDCLPPLDQREVDTIIESAFKQDHSDLPPDDTRLDDLIEQEYRREVARRTARRRLDAEEVADLWTPPPSVLTVKDELELPDDATRYTVESLQGEGHNVLVTAQFKTGKSTLAGNYVKSLVDGEPFLGQFAVRPISGRVAFWNYELQPQDFRGFLRRLNLANPDRASVLHLRGYRMPVAVEQIQQWIVDWLVEREVEVLILDPWARVLAGNGDENSNTEVGRLLDTLDVIKREAGVSDMLMTAHTPRAAMEHGEERARGASRIDDWADARWLYTRLPDGTRYLRAEGRYVTLDESRLDFDPLTERLTLAGGSRKQHAVSQVEDEALAIVTASPGLSTSDVMAQITSTKNRNEQHDALKALKSAGRIHDIKVRTSKLLYPGPPIPEAYSESDRKET